MSEVVSKFSKSDREPANRNRKGEQMIKLKNKKMEEKRKRLKWDIGTGIRALSAVFLIMIAVIVIWRIKHADLPDIAGKGKDFLAGEEGEVTTVTESILEETVRKGSLYTAEYPYNGYTAVYEEDQKTVKYYVAYEGTVKAGIDVRKIEVSLEEDTNTIFIRLPKAVVTEPRVNPGTMEYIFEDEKYNTETVAQEAYRAACEDLAERVQGDANIRANAEESAKAAEKALVEPWVNQINDGKEYKVKVLAYGEEKEDG